ncbi:45494_t:CDS:2 [Gigaspora margarita]|uniref:45494_t:CDS:1 n=1 Tax=Gigaspora margarita TaxID=4874 RepID=A0ABN7UIV3_GIGMA|nr:45494_t:CDS:2 [Gigaspora margarita]
MTIVYSSTIIETAPRANEVVTSQEIDNIQNNSSDEENFLSNKPKKRRRGGGPKRDPVWDDVNLGDPLGDGIMELAANIVQLYGIVESHIILKRHLARKCAEVPYEIKEIWRDNLAMEEKTIRRRNKTEMKSGFSKTILEERQRQIVRATLTGWVSKVERLINTELEDEMNLTLKHLFQIKDYSTISQTGDFLAEEIDNVLNEIGVEKFAAVITDHGSNIRFARRLVNEQYNFILNIRCASDLSETDELIKQCEVIVNFFHHSVANGYLKKGLTIINIEGGELKTYYSCIRMQPVFDWLISNYATTISNKTVFNLIQNHEFFNRCCHISAILKPIKDIINQLKSQHATIADCYVALIKVAAAINCLLDTNLFKPKAIKIYKLWSKGYWIKTRSIYKICETAATIWQELGYDKTLLLKWWLSIDAQKDSLAELDIKIFSISPSQAVSFCYTNIKSKLNFYGKELLKCDLRDSVNVSIVNSSQLEFEQSEEFSNSFELISGSYNNNMQSDDMDEVNLLIEEIIDLPIPAFIGNNSSFIENQNT